jgi:paraquat-inducible protein B
MTVIYKNLSFVVLVVTAMSLLIFTTVQNASATSSEIRMLADLNPTDGGIADGRADYRERGNSMRLNVEVEDVSPNTTFTVEISGNTLGTITTNSFGTAELELNTNDGQVVPKALRGDLVQIFQGTELVLSGAFDGVDGNIENGGQAPITPNQNSVMQAGNSSTNLFTVPSSNTTLQDAPVTVTNSSSNNATIQNLQQQIVALQQTVDALQQALMALQSGPQEGNVTISSGNNNNNTAVSPIQ